MPHEGGIPVIGGAFSPPPKDPNPKLMVDPDTLEITRIDRKEGDQLEKPENG